MNKKGSGKENIMTAAKVLTALLLPFLLCLFYCAVRGGSLFKLYLPDSVNNDCLFYYKLVEGTVSSGMPKGYFGFNESHALFGSFAAWNPFILLPWAVFGKIFGWHFASPFIANILFFSVSLAAFTLLARPEWKSMLCFYGLLFLFPAVPVHVLNALPECMMVSGLILYYAFAFACTRERRKTAGIIGMFVLAFFLTVIRPYMVLFFFLPWFYLRKESKPAAYAAGICSAGLAVSLNLLCSHYLTSEYFTPLYDLTFFKHLLSGQIADALRDIKYTFLYVFPEIVKYFKGAFENGLTAGCQYFVAVFTAVFLAVCAFMKDRKNREIAALHAFSVFAVFTAVLFLLQKANEGGRHLFLFAVTGCLVLCMIKAGAVKDGMVLLLAAFLVFFLIKGAFVPTDYDVPFYDAEAEAEVKYWEETFSLQGIQATDETGYENSVIWVLWDNTEEGRVATNVEGLYALPKGMGISCCEDSYVKENIKYLKCGYIASVPDGEIDELCRKEGFEEIGRSGNLVFFRTGP